MTLLRPDDAWIDAALAAAAGYGVDLTLPIENLRRTPAQRLARLGLAAAPVAELRGAIRRHSTARRGDG